MAITETDINNIRFIAPLKTAEIKNFVLESLRMYGSDKKLSKAGKVATILLDMLAKRKQIIKGQELKPWVEIMVAAALLHNLFYDGSVTSLFKAREKLQTVADFCKLPSNGSYAIFQAIECQLGDDTPIESCRPIPSTPNELFAWACWFVDEYGEQTQV